MKKIIFVVIFLGIIGLIFWGYVGSLNLIKDIKKSQAEKMAEKYVSQVYSEYKIVGKICQGEDTNNDSYVSCDVRIRSVEASSTEKVLELSCPTWWKSITGNVCKESRLAIPGQ